MHEIVWHVTQEEPIRFYGTEENKGKRRICIEMGKRSYFPARRKKRDFLTQQMQTRDKTTRCSEHKMDDAKVLLLGHWIILKNLLVQCANQATVKIVLKASE